MYSLSSEGVREAVVVGREMTVEALKNKLNSELVSAIKPMFRSFTNNNNNTCKRSCHNDSTGPIRTQDSENFALTLNERLSRL